MQTVRCLYHRFEQKSDFLNNLAPRLQKNFMLNSAEREVFPAHKC